LNLKAIYDRLVEFYDSGINKWNSRMWYFTKILRAHAVWKINNHAAEYKIENINFTFFSINIAFFKVKFQVFLHIFAAFET